MENELFTWINDQVAERGWSNNELARRAKISGSSISLVLNGQRGITADFCSAIAMALDVSPDYVMRLAGLLPSMPPAVENEHELLMIYRQLNADHREAMRAMAQALKETEEKYATGGT